MTRKHFQALAAALRESHPGLTDHDTPDARRVWRRTVSAVGDVCGDTNPRFDWPKFRDACIPEGQAWEGAA